MYSDRDHRQYFVNVLTSSVAFFYFKLTYQFTIEQFEVSHSFFFVVFPFLLTSIESNSEDVRNSIVVIKAVHLS